MTKELSQICLFFVMFCLNIFSAWDRLSDVNPILFLNKECFFLGMFCTGIQIQIQIQKYKGKKYSGKSYTRVILTEIYHLLGMKSFRDDVIGRMKTGWGRLVLAS